LRISFKWPRNYVRLRCSPTTASFPYRKKCKIKPAQTREDCVIPEVTEQIEKAPRVRCYPNQPLRASQVLMCDFFHLTYDNLKPIQLPLPRVLDANSRVPGFRMFPCVVIARSSPSNQSPIRMAEAQLFRGRMGDVFYCAQALTVGVFKSPGQNARSRNGPRDALQLLTSTFLVLLMGWGIEAWRFFAPIPPADIAPTLARSARRVATSDAGAPDCVEKTCRYWQATQQYLNG